MPRFGLLTASLINPPQVQDCGGNLFVSGVLEASESRESGHVDFTIKAPSGETLYEAVVRFRTPPAQEPSLRNQPRGPRTASDPKARYSIEFPGLPPKGSVVRVTLDRSPHVAKETR